MVPWQIIKYNPMSTSGQYVILAHTRQFGVSEVVVEVPADQAAAFSAAKGAKGGRQLQAKQGGAGKGAQGESS